MKMKITDFNQRKLQQKKLAMITCYDYTFAQLVNQTDIDIILVGDSAAMVMHGFESTISATMEMMVMHTRAVAKGAPDKWIVGDMPFLSYRRGFEVAMEAIQQLMQAGANMIKIEGCAGNEELIRHCVESGVPVMGHLGLTPQLIHQIGGFKVQGKQPEAASELIEQAQILAEMGCAAIVLECVPSALASMITQALSIPVIGIGAGAEVDGQVLVLQDLLGLNPGFKPKFLKTYGQGFGDFQQAINGYVQEVQTQVFPETEHSYA